jgi:hypothetical protein
MKIKTKLTKLCDGIYLCEIDNAYDLAMTFCRAQEFYESPFEEIRNKNFTMMQFQRLYSLKRNGYFSYPEDWAGFNIPGSILEKFYKGDWITNDWNEYDGVFKKLINHIGNDKPFYLIGAVRGDKDTIDHELCHAFYNLKENYKKEVDKLISKIPKKTFNKMRKALKDTGYCNKVIKDEIQAYLSSSDCSFFDDYNYWEENQKIGKVFANHFNKHIALNIKK